MAEIDKDMKEVDRLKAERLTKKSDVDSMEENIAKVKTFSQLLSLRVFVILFHSWKINNYFWAPNPKTV